MAISLTDVKNYLNVTYEDADTDTKLNGIMERAHRLILGFAGLTSADTLDDDDEQLELDLCRYIWNDAYEDFQRNFINEIGIMRSKYAVAAFEAETEAKNGENSG